MQIALDATYAVDRRPTGVGVYSRRILEGLATAYPEICWKFCLRPHRFLRAWKKRWPAHVRRRLLLDSLAVSHDLFHGLNQRLPRWRPRRAVVTFHDLFVLTSAYASPEFRRRFSRQARQAAEQADLIIAVSHFTASQLRDLLGVEPARIRVVHHGVDLPPMPSATREKIILHVGALQIRKNLQPLIRAFEAVPPGWRLVLVGSRGYGAEQIIEEALRSRRAQDIQLTGYVTQRELEQLYARASIFAFPSLDEGFGIPVLEAMAYGLPVLTSNRSALPEACGESAILVDPFNQEEITEKLRWLCLDEEARIRLSQAGRERARQFSWAKAVEKTWLVYQELL